MYLILRLDISHLVCCSFCSWLGCSFWDISRLPYLQEMVWELFPREKLNTDFSKAKSVYSTKVLTEWDFFQLLQLWLILTCFSRFVSQPQQQTYTDHMWTTQACCWLGMLCCKARILEKYRAERRILRAAQNFLVLQVKHAFDAPRRTK